MFKSLIRFHSAKKMDNYVRELGKKDLKKKKKNRPKESTEQVKT